MDSPEKICTAADDDLSTLGTAMSLASVGSVSELKQGFGFATGMINQNWASSELCSETYLKTICNPPAELSKLRQKALTSPWPHYVLGTRPHSVAKEIRVEHIEFCGWSEGWAHWHMHLITEAKRLKITHVLRGFRLDTEQGGPPNPFAASEEEIMDAYNICNHMCTQDDTSQQLMADWDLLLSILLSSLCKTRHADMHIAASQARKEAFVVVARIVQDLLSVYAMASVSTAAEYHANIGAIASSPLDCPVRERVDRLMSHVRVYTQIFSYFPEAHVLRPSTVHAMFLAGLRHEKSPPQWQAHAMLQKNCDLSISVEDLHTLLHAFVSQESRHARTNTRPKEKTPPDASPSRKGRAGGARAGGARSDKEHKEHVDEEALKKTASKLAKEAAAAQAKAAQAEQALAAASKKTEVPKKKAPSLPSYCPACGENHSLLKCPDQSKCHALLKSLSSDQEALDAKKKVISAPHRAHYLMQLGARSAAYKASKAKQGGKAAAAAEPQEQTRTDAESQSRSQQSHINDEYGSGSGKYTVPRPHRTRLSRIIAWKHIQKKKKTQQA
jgi:hypothetical protein